MPKLRFRITMSLDGYVAGPRQSRENPLGEGGEALHEWVFATRSARATHGMDGGETGVDDERSASWNRNVGATIMGPGRVRVRRARQLAGRRSWAPAGYECVELVSSPAVAHYSYVRRDG